MPFPSTTFTAPELEDFQFEYNGLVMGAATSFGLLNIEGLSLPEIRSGDTNWPRDHGQAMGLDLYPGRDVLLDVRVKSNGTSLQSSQLELAAATVAQPDEETPLWFQLPNLPVLCVMCRPRKRAMKIDSDYAAAQVGVAEVSLHATDPRVYGAGVETPFKMVPTTGETVVLENGTEEMRPIVVFTGPIGRPKIGNETIAGKPFLELVNPKAEEEEKAAKAAREVTEIKELKKRWLIELENAEITTKQLEEKEALLRKGEPPRTKAEEEAKVAAEAAEAVALKARETEEEEGLKPTVKAGDQLLVDLGTPHRITYYTGGIEANKPTDAQTLLTSLSTWWDLIPGNNSVKFSSMDEADTGGTATVAWAPASQL